MNWNHALTMLLLATSIAMGATVCQAVELHVTAPEEVHSDADSLTFQLTAEGYDVDRVTRVVWNLSYYKFYERNTDPYDYMEPVTLSTLSDLVVARDGAGMTIAEMERLCREHGTLAYGESGEDVLVLQFSIKVEAFAGDEKIGETPSFDASFDFIATPGLSLTVSGPEEITRDMEEATFALKISEEDQVEEVGWFFEYHTDVEWAQEMFGGWLSVPSQGIFGIVKPVPCESLKLREEGEPLNLTYLRELAQAHAPEETGSLRMRVYVKAYLPNRSPLAESNPHEFRVLTGERNITLDLYPTRANKTRVRIQGTGTDPVNIALQHALPPHLNATFDRVVQARPDGSYPKLEIVFELDPSRSPGLQLPGSEDITFVTSSGQTERRFTVKLQLLKAQWLILVYFVWDTEPPLQDKLEGNLKEICDVSRRLDDPRVGIMILTDMEKALTLDPALHGVPSLPPDNAQLYRIVEGKLIQTGRDWGSVRMNNGATLARFISESVSRVPSIHKQLAMSGHGHGVVGLLPDSSANKSRMPIRDLDRALANHFFDVISFEACLMAQLEVLNEIREHATYFIASERTIPSGLRSGLITKTITAGGLAWRESLEVLFSRPEISPRDYAVSIVQAYEDKYSEGGAFRTSATLSAVEAANLPPLVASVDSLARAIVERYGAHSALFNSTMIDVVKRTWEANHVHYTDIRDLAQNIVDDPDQILRGLVAPAKAVVSAFDRAVIANTEIIIKHPRMALFLDHVGLDEGVDYVTRIDSGYSGITIFLWREGIAGKPGGLYRSYLAWFKTTEYRTKAWRDFVEQFARSHPTSATTVSLHHPLHELYLHLYDKEGHHVGVNHDAAHGLNGLEMEIPGSLYYDFQNGTEIIILPSDISEFTVVVDGRSMEEEVEDYTLSYELVLDNQIICQKDSSGTITEGSNHSVPISIEGSEITLGEVTEEIGTEGTGGEEEGEDGVDVDEEEGQEASDALPEWFTDNFPFLMPILDPILDPILPYVPDSLIPVLPLIIIAVPILLVVGLASRALRGGQDGAEE